MARSLSKKISFYKSWILDLIFPRFCFGCKKELGSREPGFICPECLSGFKFNPSLQCIVCQSRSPFGDTCLACRSKTKIKGLVSVLPYQDETARKLIYALKYHGIESIAATLCELAEDFIRKEKLKNFFENAVLIPVPLHKSRLRKRGFNQSELIARKLGEKFGIKTVCDLILRSKMTEVQAEIKDFEKRKENVSFAFVINTKKDLSAYKNSKIILVDDVITSGSTLEACASILSQAGFRKIYALAIARG